MGNFEDCIDTIEMVAGAIDGDEKSMRDTIEHMTGERPDDDASRDDLREAVTSAILEWPLSVERDGAALEVTLTVRGPDMVAGEAVPASQLGDDLRLVRDLSDQGDEMRYADGWNGSRLTYGGMSATTILDFFEEVV